MVLVEEELGVSLVDPTFHAKPPKESYNVLEKPSKPVDQLKMFEAQELRFLKLAKTTLGQQEETGLKFHKASLKILIDHLGWIGCQATG